MDLSWACTMRLREAMGNHPACAQMLGPGWQAVEGGAAAASSSRGGDDSLLMRGMAEML